MGPFGPKALTFIHSLARKSLTKGQGSGITKIPSAMQAEAKASEIFTNLVEAGLKPEMMDDFIRSEADVAKYLNILDAYKRERMKPIPADSPRGREITEALFGKRGTVVDMKGNVIPEGSGIMGGESIESLMKSGDVTKGTVTKKSKKVTDRDMFKAANQRFKVKEKPIDPTFDENMPFDNAAEKIAEIRMSNQNYITDTISKIKSMDPIEAMKEANKVIKREGPYKNLNQQQAKKILEDTEDHIFERNVTPKETDVPMEETADEVTKAYIDAVRKGKFKGTEDQFRDMIDKMMDEDFASGGRVGLRYGGDTMGGKNDKSKSSPGPDRSKVSAQQERSHQEAISRARDSQQYDYTVPKEIVKDIAINTGKNLAGQKIASTLGIGTTPIGILMALKGLYDQTRNPVYSEEDLTLNSAVDKLGKTLFPEGNLQNIKATSPTQKDYNIRATKDMVENLPGGVVKDILAPAGALVMSPFYDAGQAFDRMEPGSGLRGFAKALDAENPLSSAAERFIGAAGPLAERFEDGGRVGLAGGMTRRAFLKLMGGVAAGIGAVKSGIMSAGKKGVTKKVVKEVVKTPPVTGKPEWFDALVNKVILEGDDVTKKLATKDREIVHTKKINDQESVTVTQDLDDGAIRVEYDSPDNMGQEPVMMQFKPGMADETTGGKKPADRFDVVETEPRYTGGPEDGDIEFIGESGGPGISFLESDVTNLKTFATGKGPTMKEIVKSKKRKDLVRKVNDDSYEAAEFIGGKYGDAPEPDFPDDYSGYASGGLAYLLGE